MCLTKGSTQQHSHKPQQRQPTHVNQVTSEPTDPDSSTDDEYLQCICPEYRYTRIKIPTMSAVINEIPVDMTINTGASNDILDKMVYHKVNYNGNITQELS